MEAETAVLPPGSELHLQFIERPTLSGRDVAILEAVLDGELEVGHPLPRFEGQECPVSVQRDDVDAGKAFEDRAVHHDEGPPIGDTYKFSVRLRQGCRWADRFRRFFEERHDGPGRIFVNTTKTP